MKNQEKLGFALDAVTEDLPKISQPCEIDYKPSLTRLGASFQCMTHCVEWFCPEEYVEAEKMLCPLGCPMRRKSRKALQEAQIAQEDATNALEHCGMAVDECKSAHENEAQRLKEIRELIDKREPFAMIDMSSEWMRNRASHEKP